MLVVPAFGAPGPLELLLIAAICLPSCVIIFFLLRGFGKNK